MKPRMLYVIAALLLLWWLDRSCQYQRGGQDALLRAAGDTTDVRVAELLAREVQREAEIQRTEKVHARESDGIRHQLAHARRIADSLASLPDTTPALLAAKDTVIARLDSALAFEERRVAFYRTHLVALTDSVIPEYQRLVGELTHQRNAWMRSAERPRYMVTDFAGSALAGYGMAEENKTLVLVGVSTVVVPRVVKLIGRLF